ncbi:MULTISPECIES: flavin monoamine oxidase family protein [Phyllobacteriaceae]|jgi:monoamine oxidase|uniref:Monoamine oxidase n=1 Tax=Mesorhizobium hungaricum TaxID=1566387 RepID=A0A1C2DGE8_9HYPH|nr:MULTISPECIES: flavin monoamine oxidase family protein [Mesorhizobium]MBN9232423.1 flavin monoamine oxidase family protein [Mesorhizobium sp.]MDQ0330020.1 monoamine oxidase [Mesorhizobium sp. YL-MeA3-2017]OCX13832.1 monoamine oxidase [Mesorhizobium hungaricum]
MIHDVIVIGAGFAGLSAALALRDAGLEVLVLEARQRVGGRVESRIDGLGDRYDSGGQFLCEDMPQVMALAFRHGKTLVPAPTDGAFTLQPSMSEEDGEALWLASFAIRERMNAIDPADPAIRDLSVADWLARQPDAADAKSAFRSTIEGLWCQPLDAVPLWYLVDNDRRITNEVSELQYFPGETMHRLAEDLAAGLGDRIRLSTPVTEIRREESGVVVVTPAGPFQALHVVVAVPPVTASRIAFSPPLPAQLAGALGAWRCGTVIKMRLRYARAFWRDEGRNGMVLWRDIHGLFACDTSRDDGHTILTVFAGGPLALRLRALGADGMRAEVLDRLVAALGTDARDVLDFAARDWSDEPWSGGGYSDSVADFSAQDAEAVLRAGASPIHFACSELSLSFPGYVEGAIVSGRRAAEAVCDMFDLPVGLDPLG